MKSPHILTPPLFISYNNNKPNNRTIHIELINMNIRNIIIFTSIIVLLFSICTVSATNNTDDTDNHQNIEKETISTVEVDNNIEKISKEENKNIKETRQKQVYVSPNGKDYNDGTYLKPYKTINKAINVVNNNDKIILKEGTHYIDNDYTTQITKNITLTSNNKDKTIIKSYTASTDLFKVNKGVTFTVSNVQFRNIERGAIISNYGCVKLDNVNVVDCNIYHYATQRALINNYANITINKGEFHRNKGYNGTALYNTANATITNTNIWNSNALFGGAIYSHTGKITIRNSKILSNTVNGSEMNGWDSENYVFTGGLGGAIYNNGIMDIYQTTFHSNKIPEGQYHRQLGGCIYSKGKLSIHNSQILYSYIYGSAGAIYSEGTLKVVNSTINHNEAENYAGAILNNEQAIIINSTINRNKGFRCAAILNNYRMQFTNTVIGANTGEITVIINNANITMKNVTALYNSAETAGVLQNYGNIGIHSSVMIRNTGYWGGVLESYEGKILINNSKLNSNKANAVGGAIYSTDTSISIVNSELHSNTANETGGAISSQNNSITIKNTSICGNKLKEKPNTKELINQILIYDSHELYSYGGALYLIGKTTKILNSKIFYNTADCGGAIAIMNGTLLINDSNIQGNTARQTGGAITTYLGENDFNPKINITRTNINRNIANNGTQAIFNGLWVADGGELSIYNSNINYNGRSTNYADDNDVISNGGTVNLTNTTLRYNKGSTIINTGYMNISNSVISNNVNHNGSIISSATRMKISNTKLKENVAKYTIRTVCGQGEGLLTVTKSTLYNSKNKYEIYNDNEYSENSNVKCDNNWWGTKTKPTNRVYNCKINSFYKGLN